MSMIPLFVASVIGSVVGFLLVEMVTMNIYLGAIQESKIGGETMKKLIAPIEMQGYSGIIGVILQILVYAIVTWLIVSGIVRKSPLKLLKGSK